MPIIQIGSFTIQSLILTWLVAIWIGASITERECKRRGIQSDHVWNVTLVGVLAADSLLSLDDYKASERTFQLVTQVAGRAGRGIGGKRYLYLDSTPETINKYAALDGRKLGLTPGTVEVGTMLVEEAEQIWKLVTRLFTAGLGFTVSTTFCEGPGGHPKAAGVTW